MALRDGFIVPNSATYAPDYQTAQPDQGDYLVLGNSRYGVVAGCEVSLQGGTVVIGSGANVVAIDGALVSIPSGNSAVTISGSNADPRFDLVVVDIDAGLTAVQGTPAANPVFPDIDAGMVVLAAIYTNTSGDHHVIDKRNFLQPSIFSVQNAASPYYIVKHHSSGMDVKFSIDGNGKFSWQDDTYLERESAGVLRVTDTINVDTLAADTSITVNGEEVITEGRIKWDLTINRAGTGDIGDIFVDTATGALSIWKPDPADQVEKWLTVQPNMPAGAVIMSFLPPASMPGFLPLDGRTVTKAEAGNLWYVHPEWQAPDGSNFLTVPKMDGRFPIGITSNVNVSNGTVRDAFGTMGVTLETANLPRHKHQAGTSTDSGGSHQHTVSISGGSHTHTVDSAGSHAHSINDPGHYHAWNDGWPIVATEGDHDSCMDNPFTDSSHNYRTKPSVNSTFGWTGILINPAGTHSHGLSGGGTHTHTGTIAMSGSHTHPLPAHNEVGEGKEITFAPPTVSIYFYIKT